MKKKDQVERILADNTFATLATASKDGKPWSTPLFFAFDDDLNLYWYSRKDTRHSQFLAENPQAAVSLFGIGTSDDMVWLYIEGNASEVPVKDLPHALSVYAQRAAKDEKEHQQLRRVADFSGLSQLRLYQLKPEHLSLSTDAKKWHGKWMDGRKEVGCFLS